MRNGVCNRFDAKIVVGFRSRCNGQDRHAVHLPEVGLVLKRRLSVPLGTRFIAPEATALTAAEKVDMHGRFQVIYGFEDDEFDDDLE